jgi:indolepyruvate ferredoxin oxidoreductase alpha subunit
MASTSMGAALGNGQGFFHAGIKQKVVAVTGDSCFFHADMPELVNAVYNKADILLYVMDNRTTAMTSHQPHPGAFGVTATGEATKIIDIAEIAKAFQADFVAVVDPYDQAETRAVIKQALSTNGVRVVVARRPCAVIALRALRKEGG